MTVYPILGRILSHGYLVAGHLPVRIALPTLIGMLLGPKKIAYKILVEAFLDYISAAERAVFKEALAHGTEGRFSASILSNPFECSVTLWLQTASNPK